MHSFSSYFGILQRESKEGVEKYVQEKERRRNALGKLRKENQKPHGKVKAFAELVEGTEKRDEYFITFFV